MIVRKPSSQFTTASSSSSIKSSLKPPSVLADDWDADDEAMSSEDYLPTPPLTVSIPKSGSPGPYCPRRPTLREILANTSSPPWTFAAFMAYLSNNHCLETLEFTMDAGRYKKHFSKMMSRASDGGLPPAKDREYVQALWERLVEAYIRPNGSREVNLPSEVRDPIVHVPVGVLPPAPETLDRAVAKIYELMEESVLVPFLNSFYPQSAHPALAHRTFDQPDDTVSVATSVSETRSLFGRRTRAVRSTPPVDLSSPHASTLHPQYMRKSAPSPLTASSKKSPFNVKLTQTTSSPAAPLSDSGRSIRSARTAIHIPGMTDDSGSNSSPSYDSPSTPPTSPPTSDVNESKRDSGNSGVWQRLGKLGRMKTGRKKSSDRWKNDEL